MPAVDTRIAQGWGSYGIVELWRLTNGDFSLIGQDEHGKQYIFQWTGCEQIGPIPYDNSADRSEDTGVVEPDCDVNGDEGNDIVYLATQEPDPGCEYEEPEYEYPR